MESVKIKEILFFVLCSFLVFCFGDSLYHHTQLKQVRLFVNLPISILFLLQLPKTQINNDLT